MSTNNSNPLNGIGTEQAKPTDAGLTLDTIFHILSNSRRRHSLAYLITAETPVAFAELVDAVAEAEYDRPIDHISSDERHTIYTSLYQTHLPTLNQAEIVTYERVSGEIDTGKHFNVLANYLSRLSERGVMERLASSVADAVAHL